MARPGQQEYRKRKALEAEEEDSDSYYIDEAEGHSGGIAPRAKGLAVLPVAELDDDFEGEAEDGAMYLALANRENAKLPSFTRVPNPYRETAAENQAADEVDISMQAGPSKHPALPKEAWTTLFSIHYKNYRKDIHSRWPPSPLPPYPTTYPPIPSFENRHEWIYFINGYSRRKVRVTDPEDPRIRSQKAFLPSRPAKPAPAVTAELEENEEDVMNGDADEEEEMNAAPPIYDVEEESERHRPREPTVAILCRLDNRQIITVLLQIAFHLSRQIDELSTRLNFSPSPGPPSVRPNTPDTRAANPYTALMCKWAFACLLVLDEHILPDDIHHLREFARVVMRVGGWRWIKAVQDGEIEQSWEIGTTTSPSAENVVGDVSGAGGEQSADATLSRCWLTVSAIAAGWAQHDLTEALETLFQ